MISKNIDIIIGYIVKSQVMSLQVKFWKILDFVLYALVNVVSIRFLKLPVFFMFNIIKYGSVHN